ncbi:MAG: MarR family transcriptional regulator [Afipia sp.]|jgi:DNA-binding MarR family transcriptional regulator|nr:MarR family transcriptional regulator [Afipia sp.]
MPHGHSDFLFALFETQRMLRLYADRLAVRYGITRAQWAVLAKLERSEGLKQSELAELMEMQPITLTRLIDRLCDSDLIERREDARDRRANRLYLRPAARPLLARLAELRAEITRASLNHFTADEAEALVAQLDTIKSNVRDALHAIGDAETKDQRYG